MEKISIPLFDYKDHKIIESLPDQLTFTPHYLDYRWMVTLERMEDTIPKKIKYQGQTTLFRQHIFQVDAAYDNDKECFSVGVLMRGGGDHCFLFKTLKEAIELKDKIVNWILDGKN